MGDDLHAVVRRELELLDPSIRRDPEAVRARLHPDYREVGASGRVWDIESIVAALAGDDDDTPAETRELEPIVLADDVVLLTYWVRRGERSSRRVSLWQLVDGDWRVRYHQGTIVPDG
ncbi:MAG TPA: nuclear transport factor 2 family protein [Gaiellales bacterium]